MHISKVVVYVRIILAAQFIMLATLLIPAQGFAQTATPEEIDRQVEVMLGKLTLEEKIALIHGVSDMVLAPAVPKIGLPELRTSDGPMGVRSWGPSTAYAAGIGLAASWDRELAERVGQSIGRDARARGVHILLGPGVNIYRAPMNGRNFEYFGEDPYLAGQIAAHYIRGVQSQNVVATVKHFAANNSEYDRNNINSMVDERTLREIYLPAFEAAVKEGHVGAAMDSYNQINGEHATQNRLLNTDILKKEWGFRGILMSDWYATYDGVAAANSGLDVEMPTGKFMNEQTLLPALKSGTVSLATLDDKVRRVLRIAGDFRFIHNDQKDLSIPLYDPKSQPVALDSALESTVLLKNQDHILPLDLHRTHTIAVIGPESFPAQPTAGGSANVTAIAPVSVLEGLTKVAGPNTKVLWSPGLKDLQTMKGSGFSVDAEGRQPGLKQEEFDLGTFSATHDRAKVVPAIDFTGPDDVHPSGKTLAIRWTGFYIPPVSGPQLFITKTVRGDGDTYQLYVNGELVVKDAGSQGEPQSAEVNLPAGKAVPIRFEYTSQVNVIRVQMVALPTEVALAPDAVKLAAMADVAVVTVGFDRSTETEGHDRTFMLPPGQESLIKAVASANPRTVVVLTAGGSVSTTGWLQQVPAFLETWYAGSQGGTALAQILFGSRNPSGKLPMSWWRKEEDDPTFSSYYLKPGSEDLKYAEGIFVGYRAYGRTGNKPEFPFGFGLSYTDFAFSHFVVAPFTAASDALLTVAFDVTNKGSRAGAEVAQVYVSDPSAAVPRPERELKGFARVVLKPGESRRVTIKLNRRALSYWDSTSHTWRVDPGKFVIRVGDSAENTPLNCEIVTDGKAQFAAKPAH